MIDLKINVTEKDSGWDEFADNLDKLAGKKVVVGIQSNEDTELLKYANANEFGAEIDHPGGTSYGYKTKKAAEDGRVSFLKAGQGYMELGVTGPHKIIIPPRPFIRQTFEKRFEELTKTGFSLGEQVMFGTLTLDSGLMLWGDEYIGFIRQEVAEGNNFEPNAPSTIRKKGGGKHPLQDSGRLMQALKAVVS